MVVQEVRVKVELYLVSSNWSKAIWLCFCLSYTHACTHTYTHTHTQET